MQETEGEEKQIFFRGFVHVSFLKFPVGLGTLCFSVSHPFRAICGSNKVYPCLQRYGVFV